MKVFSEKLREAARAGSAVELKALLQDPGCDALGKTAEGQTALMGAANYGNEACIRLHITVSDALAKDMRGMSALMHAAHNGNMECVGLLLPVSDILAKGNGGLTTNEGARIMKRESLAQFIDAYALSQSDQWAIDAAVGTGASRGRAAPRV